MKKCFLGSNLKFKGKTLSGFLIFFPVCVFFFDRTVYDRVPHLAPYQRTMLTYTVSTIWHGFYPGYYLTFLNAILIIVATRTVSKHKWMFINLVARGCHLPKPDVLRQRNETFKALGTRLVACSIFRSCLLSVIRWLVVRVNNGTLRLLTKKVTISPGPSLPLSLAARLFHDH